MTLELWTRVECLCGRSAAIPEAGCFPLCGGCGRRMVVPRGGVKATERVSMVCEPMETSAAVRRVREVEPAPEFVSEIPGHARVYSDEGLLDALRAGGWPTERCDGDWPKRSMGDGSRTRVAPWEIGHG